MLVTIMPRYAIFPNAAGVSASAGASEQSVTTGSWAEEISHNSASEGTVSVPPIIRVANAAYGLDNQQITASDCSTIQTQVINYSSRTMQSYSTGISITLPSGASAPALTATTQGAGLITLAADNTSGNPYTWHISGGTASPGSYINYTFTYNLNGRQFIQKAASYVDLVELGAGWQNYVERRNFSDVTHTREEYTAVLSGSCSSGSGYTVYASGGTGNYNMLTGGGSSGFTAGPGGAYDGMKLWDPGYDNRENCSVWYCGQPGKDGNNNDNVDGGNRAYLDVYYDPTVVTNISQLGIKLLYWRSTSPSQTPTMYQEKMLYLLGNPLFSNGDSSNTTAQSYFYSTNAQNNRSQYINSNPGTMVFNFAGTALPADGQKVTFASAIYGVYEQQVYLTTWDAWLITFHVVDKSALRSLIATEDTAYRQIQDGYTNTDGSFTAYLTQLAKSKAVLNQPNATAAQITAAVNDLNTAKSSLKYVPANYTALNTLVSGLYSTSLGFRPSPVNDPDYYYMTSNYYPSAYYQSTSDLAALLASVEYGHDIRYQSYIDSMTASINTAWRAIILKNSDYTTVNYYLGLLDGLNDETGSAAGNYIMANGTNYPQYLNQMLYWKDYTESSYATWESAVNGVTLGLKIPDQATVNNMGIALQAAFNGMTIKPADYTDLNTVRTNALTAINSKVYVHNPDGGGYLITTYTAASISAMQNKINSIVDGLLMPEQGRVITWTDELQALYDAKTVNSADYTFANAQKAIQAAHEADYAAFYTAASWQALVNARSAVQPGLPATQQATVDTWAANIFNTRNSLVYNPADYSAVTSAIAAANVLTPANYQNWSAVQKAINDVDYGLDITYQASVDNFAANIYAAINNLVPANADTGALLTALASAAALIENIYTPASWAVLVNAVAAGAAIRDAVPAYNYTQQPAVDAAALAINNAIDGLVYMGADYAGVTAAITAANALNPSDYKNWPTVQTAINAVVYGLNITVQSTVDGYAAAINTAVNNLVYINADLSGLISALAGAAALDENLYTPETWNPLAAAATAGAAVRNAIPAYNITRQTEVDSAALAINNAITGLVYRNADYSGVTTAISAAGALNPADYKNWPAVQAAIDAVVYGLDITNQSTVDGYAAAINTAINNLVYVDADLSGLISALAGAAALDKNLYTPASWAALGSAETAGISIRDAMPAYNIKQQTDVNAAASAVTDAIAGLVYRDADLSGLAAAINSAAALKENIYTPETWSVLANAVTAGIAIRDAALAYNITKQADVDAAALDITNAVAGLAETVVTFAAAPGSTAVIDAARGFITGLPADGSLTDLVAQGYIEIIGNGHFVYMPTANGFGTGTKVELIRDADGKVMATYYIVIFGDIDGDGLADGNDTSIASMLSDGMLTQGDLSAAAYYAADANHDGAVNNLDTQLLEQAGLFLAEISQSVL
jgi:hypothetical protein